MPWTIYRYILKELIRLMALTTIVLVTMISFAAAIKPMSEGMLSASSMLKFVGYSAPTMLGFALPFAGAFASTLVFIRMASDNEILACSASGMSYTRILAPVAALGLCLTMGLFFLSNFVVPNFYREAAETLETDLMSVLVTQLNQDRPFDEFDGYVLYADQATQMPAPDYTRATQFIQLKGVAVGEVDQQQRVWADSTGRVANILLFQDQERSRSRVTIKLLDAMRYQADIGKLNDHESLEFGPIEIPSPFTDDPKFLSWPQLRRLDREPDRFGDVRDAKLKLAQETAIAELRTTIRDRLRAERGTGTVKLVGALDTYRLSSPSVRTVSGELILESRPNRPIVVEYPADGQPEHRIEAQSGHITIKPGRKGIEPYASIHLTEARVFELSSDEPSTEKLDDTLPPMTWPTPIIDPDAAQMPLPALEQIAEHHYHRSRNVSNAKAGLDRNVHKLGRKILSQLHERAASAITCMMLLIFGALLAIHLKGQMPLTVFFWSFLLAIVSIIVISTGQNLAITERTSVATGMAVLWAGNGGMALAIFLVYRKLARN